MDSFIEFLIEEQWVINFISLITILAVASNITDFIVKPAKVASILLVVVQALFSVFLTTNQTQKITDSKESIDDYKYANSLYKKENERLKKEVIEALKKLGVQSDRIEVITATIGQDIEDAQLIANFSAIKSSLGNAESTLQKVYSLNVNEKWQDILAILSADFEARSQIHSDIIAMFSDYDITDDKSLQLEMLDLIMWVNVYKIDDTNKQVKSLVTSNFIDVRQRINLLETKKRKREGSFKFLNALESKIS